VNGEVRTFYKPNDRTCSSIQKTCISTNNQPGVWTGDPLYSETEASYTATSCTPPQSCLVDGSYPTTETSDPLISILTASPQLIKRDGTCNITSYATGIDGCVLQGYNLNPGDAFPDIKDLYVYSDGSTTIASSYDTVGPISSTTRYTLLCCDSGGIEKKNVDCNVQPISNER